MKRAMSMAVAVVLATAMESRADYFIGNGAPDPNDALITGEPLDALQAQVFTTPNGGVAASYVLNGIGFWAFDYATPWDAIVDVKIYGGSPSAPVDEVLSQTNVQATKYATAPPGYSPYVGSTSEPLAFYLLNFGNPTLSLPASPLYLQLSTSTSAIFWATTGSAGGNFFNEGDGWESQPSNLAFQIQLDDPVATTPEPGSLTLLGLGAIGLVGARVRSRRQARA